MAADNSRTSMFIFALINAGMLALSGERLFCDYQETVDSNTNATEVCDGPQWGCFAMWSTRKLVDNTTGANAFLKGCFRSDSVDKCATRSCVQQSGYDVMTNNKSVVSGFCCCNTDYCNRNFTFVDYNIHIEDTQPPKFEQGYDSSLLLSWTHITVITIFIFITLMLVFLIVHLLKKNGKRHKNLKISSSMQEEVEHQRQVEPLGSCTIQLKQLIGQGRHGRVWTGTMDNKLMSVKVFSAEKREYWQAERDMYTTLGHHPNILRFIASCEWHTGGSLEFVILTEYHPRGSLMNYLQHTIINWKEMCVLGCSVASGLEYLHNEEDTKAAIAHRDLNSKNILVKMDGACVLSDFSFAKKLPDAAKAAQNGTLSTEVGTLRYMAPEMLDGFEVNVINMEVALKQIDVYALSLVLWETAMRCKDIYGTDQVPGYKLPFETELGPDINAGHLRTYVVENRDRPAFPGSWNCEHPGMRFLKETIVDCWDDDGDARLTAKCVEERFRDLLSLCPNDIQQSLDKNTLTVVVDVHSTGITGAVCAHQE